MMQETKQLIKDASLTMQDAWKLIARRKRLTLEQRRALIAKLEWRGSSLMRRWQN